MYGKELKALRTASGITQAQLAKETKIPQQTISWIENDRGIPSLYDAVRLADYYGISIDELIDHKIGAKEQQ